jgi:cephalosporin hydroxylase
MKKKSENIIPTIAEIEEFVYRAGCDNVPAFGGKFEGGIQIQQIPDEIAPCIHEILKSGQPINAYLEIGVAAGGMTVLAKKFLNPGQIVLVDNNRHPKHHVRPYILRDIIRKEIIGDSHAPGCVDAVMAVGLGYDVIIIDGDHTYAGVRADYENYVRFLNPGGFLILHDSALVELGIKQLFDELRAAGGLEFVGEYVSTKHTFICGVALFRRPVGVQNEDN